MQYENSIEFARSLDQKDPLKAYRERFHIPDKYGKPVIYFCGNSLGLQPKSTPQFVDTELQKWKDLAVEGHFTEPNPWVEYHKLGKSAFASMVGAKESEVVAMNNLTTNLHLMLASFYQPTGSRKKIMIEKGAFPSDHFAISSHMQMKGVDPEKDLIELDIPKNGYLSNETITRAIHSAGDELALVMLPGVQYYTGQFFDMRTITKEAHKVGAMAGWDLAHAIGNVPMSLHDDNIDFAVWCTYKYLNAGPGAVAGAFVHDKHGLDTNYPRLSGWWGQNESIRFKMENKFEAMPGIDGWMLSNINILSNAALQSSLSIFEKTGMEALREKSIALTGLLEFLINSSSRLSSIVSILTPKNAHERGCQLSLFFSKFGREIFDALTENGVIMDWREPNVIRVAPTPLYNTYEEVFQFVDLCNQIIDGIE